MPCGKTWKFLNAGVCEEIWLQHTCSLQKMKKRKSRKVTRLSGRNLCVMQKSYDDIKQEMNDGGGSK